MWLLRPRHGFESTLVNADVAAVGGGGRGGRGGGRILMDLISAPLIEVAMPIEETALVVVVVVVVVPKSIGMYLILCFFSSSRINSSHLLIKWIVY